MSGPGTPAFAKRSHASASRICETSFHIELSVIDFIPKRRSSPSSLMRHDAFGVPAVKLPFVFISKSRDSSSFVPSPSGQWRPESGLAVENVTFPLDRKSTRLNSSHSQISYAVFCLKKKKKI